MSYVILPNLQVVFFYVCPVVESFKKVFMRCLAMGSIVVYRTTIILNTYNKVANCMKLRIIKGWST